MNTFIYNNYRIQVLNENLVRIEYSKEKTFLDELTYFVENRNFEDALTLFNEDENGATIKINEYKILIPKDSINLKGIIVYKDSEEVYKYKSIKNTGELPLPYKTKDVFTLIDSPRIICPKEGYSPLVKEEEPYKVEENVKDLYIFLISKDYRLLRKRYVELTGKVPLLRYINLGVWNSRYYKYNEESAKNMITSYHNHNIPLDNMVIDTDWRKASDRGIGYDIDLELFPDMKRFLDFAHSNDLEIMFNDHPEPVEGAKSALSKKEIEYRVTKLRDLLSLGLDTWWYDRNWHTKLISPTKNIYPETLGLYLFNETTKDYFNDIKSSKYHRRPVVMGNVVDIRNGRYIKITDSSSHRYPFEWSGDICSDESQILTEIESMIRCENNLISYFNSDIGGHTGNPNKETYIKWIKYGVFSPIFRPHCSMDVKRFREPWNYDEETTSIFRNYSYLRQRLTPYLYANAFKTYNEGEPFIKALSYNYPNDLKARKIKHEYLFGDDLLIASDATKNRYRLTKKDYINKVHVEYFNNKNLEGEPVLIKDYDELSFSLNGTKVEKEVPPYNFSMKLKTKIKFNEDVELYVASDDGVKCFIDGKLILDSWVDRSKALDYIANISKDEEHELYIEYYQGGNEADFELSYVKKENVRKVKMYFPEDYYDLFNGKIIKKGKSIKTSYSLNEFGVYAKLGSCIPLYKDAYSLKTQNLKEVTFDIYPSLTQTSHGFIYEDDHETIAYQDNKYNITNYRTYFDETKNAFIFNLDKTIVNDIDSLIKDKKVIIRFNLIDEFKDIKKVLVNDKEVPFNINKKDINNFILTYGETSRSNKTLSFSLDINFESSYIIEFIK